jgi:hypothetical protein
MIWWTVGRAGPDKARISTLISFGMVLPDAAGELDTDVGLKLPQIRSHRARGVDGTD